MLHGVDIVSVPRIGELLSEHPERFLERCFGPEERAYCESQPRRRVEHYAARFAAKEAVMKALGTGLTQGIRWRDIEVTRSSAGAPGVRLSGRAAEIASGLDVREWLLSLSHTESLAMASVVARCGA